MASMVPLSIFGIVLFALTTYISIDTSLGISDTLGGISGPPEDLRNMAYVDCNIYSNICAY